MSGMKKQNEMPTFSVIFETIMHQSFVTTTATPPTGKGGDNDFFSFQCPATSPTPMGQTRCQNFALCPAICNRKSPWGKDPNAKTPSIALHCVDTYKVIALHFSPAIPHPSP